jgi:hypothetical protein
LRLCVFGLRVQGSAIGSVPGGCGISKLRKIGCKMNNGEILSGDRIRRRLTILRYRRPAHVCPGIFSNQLRFLRPP